jgi:hypothetical protein
MRLRTIMSKGGCPAPWKKFSQSGRVKPINRTSKINAVVLALSRLLLLTPIALTTRIDAAITALEIKAIPPKP